METLDVLSQFQDLARVFRDAAQAGDLVRMEDVLSKRRNLLRRLSLEKPASRSTSEEVTARGKLLQAILDMDREAEGILEKQREELGAEIVALGTGRRGLEGYQAGHRQSTKWIDERG